MNEKVSVVIPAYNSELYIADCLRSVLSQTTPPEEVIVVDDCSTDRTASIVRGFQSMGVKLIRTSANSGSAAARNLGIRAASHELIAFQDSDDLWLTHHCETVVPLLRKNPEAVLAFSGTRIFQDENWTWPIDLPAGRPLHCFLWCVPCTRIPQMNVIARRKTLLAEGGYNEAMRQGQDYDLFLRLSYKHPFICSHEVTTLYRRHPDSVTVSNWNKAFSYLYRAQNSFWEEHREQMAEQLRQSFVNAVQGHWLQKLRHCWDRDDWEALNFHLSQHGLIPESASAYRHWQRRRQLSALRPLWRKLLYAKAHLAATRTPSWPKSASVPNS